MKHSFLGLMICIIIASCSKDEDLQINPIVDTIDTGGTTNTQSEHFVYNPVGEISLLSKYQFDNQTVRIIGQQNDVSKDVYDPKSVSFENANDDMFIQMFRNDNELYNQLILFPTFEDGKSGDHYLILESNIERTEFFAYVFEYNFSLNVGNYLFKLDISDLIPELMDCSDLDFSTNEYLPWMCHVSNNYILDLVELNKRIRLKFVDFGSSFIDLKEEVTKSANSLQLFQESVSKIVNNDISFTLTENIVEENRSINFLQNLELPSDVSPIYSVSISTGNNQCALKNEALSEKIELSITDIMSNPIAENIAVQFTVFDEIGNGTISKNEAQILNVGKVNTNWTLGENAVQEVLYFFIETNPFLFDFRNFEKIESSISSCMDKYISSTARTFHKADVKITFNCMIDESKAHVVGCNGVKEIIYLGVDKYGIKNEESIPFTISNINTINVEWDSMDISFGPTNNFDAKTEIRFYDGGVTEYTFNVRKPI